MGKRSEMKMTFRAPDVAVTTVIVCMFEAEFRYLKFAINSVLQQTVVSNLILVCGDNVTWIDKIREAYEERVEIIQTPPCKLGAARNLAIGRLSTAWIAFLDCDDIWLPPKLEMQLSAAAKENADLVGSCAYLVDDNDIPFGCTLSREIALPSTWLVKSSVFARHPFNPDAVPEDGPWWASLSKKYNFVRLGVPLIRYRVRGGSLSANMKGRAKKQMLHTVAFAWNLRIITMVICRTISFLFRGQHKFRFSDEWKSQTFN